MKVQPSSDAPSLWAPSHDAHLSTQMGQFMQRVNSRYQLNLRSYHQLYDWSVTEPALFWKEMSRLLTFDRNADFVVDDPSKMPGADWFSGARLNYARHCLAHPHPEAIAIYDVNEQGLNRAISWTELQSLVSKWVQFFQSIGISKGDRIAAILPNSASAVAAMLGVSALGGVWSSCSPDFGTKGICDRLQQIKPKCVIAVSAYSYKGKSFDLRDTLATVYGNLPHTSSWVLADQCALNGWISFDAISQFDGAKSIDYVACDFLDPLFILFSSGTTGPPKCMVHSVGGTLIQHVKEHQLHADLRHSDCLFYYTTCGWMMWNWMVSALASSVSIVTYDGAPILADGGSIWDLLISYPITVFGCSAGFISASQKRSLGLASAIEHSVSDLRLILSTGSPLLPAQFDWLYQQFSTPIQVGSISGGTDIVSCFALCNPLVPVYRGLIQGRGLGMDIVAWNDANEPVIGQKGELVCRSAAPSMPIGFVNDDADFTMYRSAYFFHNERPCKTWIHGDFMVLHDHGGLEILGRSDATLNPGGVRMGSAEFYQILEPMTEIIDSLVTSTLIHETESVILFVKLAPELQLDDALKQKIGHLLRSEGSPRHVPYDIVAVHHIPVTKSNKKCELAVKHILKGEDNGQNRDVLADPCSLDDYVAYANHFILKGVSSC